MKWDNLTRRNRSQSTLQVLFIPTNNIYISQNTGKLSKLL